MNDAKDSILEAIKKNKPQGEFLYPGVPIFSKSEKNILEEFKENLELGAGKWVSAGSLEEAKTLIKERYPDVKIVCSATPEIKGNKDLNSIASPHDLNDVDLGIIRAEFGVSENGMVYMAEKDMQVTALGFLSQHLVILLNPANLVRDMYEAYTKVNLQSNKKLQITPNDRHIPVFSGQSIGNSVTRTQIVNFELKICNHRAQT